MKIDTQILKNEHLKRQNSASNPVHSVWVSANAGAGKTHILVERIIRLLLPPFDCPPHKILCLTYTKAAATEMKERLFSRLGAWITKSNAELSDDLTKITGNIPCDNIILIARRLFAKILETAGGLKIQTIHGFCEHLLRRFPNETGHSKNFTLLSDIDLKNIYINALDDLSNDVLNNPDSKLSSALNIIAKDYSRDAFIDLLINSRKIYAQITADGSDFWNSENLIQELDLPPNIENYNIYADFLSLVDNTKISSLISALETAGPKSIHKSHTLKYIQIKGIDNFNLWKELFLTKEKKMQSRKNFVVKDIQKKFPDLSDYFYKLYDSFEKTYHLHNSFLLYEITKNASILLDYIYNYTKEQKYKTNSCDFDDIITRTYNLLKNNAMASFILWKLDGGIDHILLDEAQDTAPEQWGIIQKLTQYFFTSNDNNFNTIQHRTIFAVGDEKQSIYGFQGAEPEKMAENAQFFASKAVAINHKWTIENLRGSFRSSPAIMNLVDNIFQDAVAKGVLFGDSEKIEHYAVANMGPGYIEIMPPVLPVNHENSEAWENNLDTISLINPSIINARNIALKIQGILQSPDLLSSTGRPAEPKDIMVLLQNRDATMQNLIKELTALKIPVSGLDRIYLLEEIAVLDILALLDFCLYPDDDLSLAQILRSPLGTLSEEDLFTLCHNRTGTLWHSLIEHKDNNQHYLDSYNFINSVLIHSQNMSVFDTISLVLEVHQGRKKFIARLGNDCLDGIDELLTKALGFNQNKNPSLQNFVAFIRETGGDQKRDIDMAHNAVQIMTIHGSKGLEAPIVFLPNCCDSLKPNKDLYKSFIITANKIPMIIKKENQHQTIINYKESMQEKAESENKRLLYVALTRAKDALFISGKLRKIKNPDNYKVNEKSWYHYITQGLLRLDNVCTIQTENSRFPTYTYKDITENKIIYKPKPFVKESVAPLPLPTWALRTLDTMQPKKQKFISPSKTTDTEYLYHRETAQQKGIIIHKLLEHLINIPTHKHDAVIDIVLKNYNLSAETQKIYKTEIVNIFTNPDFSQIFNKNALSEVPIVGQINDINEIISGQIDLMVITNTEILLADYKTDSHLSADTALPEQYILQMALYQKLLINMYPKKIIKCFIIATAKPELIRIDDRVLNEHYYHYKEKNLKNYNMNYSQN